VVLLEGSACSRTEPPAPESALEEPREEPPPTDARSVPTPWSREVMYRFLDEGTLEEANLLLANRWPVNRFSAAELPPSPTWTEDPFHEKFWRFEFYGLRPVRHLVWAWRTTGDARYRDRLVQVMESFVAHGHDSAFAWDKHTTAYRGLSLVNIYFKLKAGGALSPELDEGLRVKIREVGQFLQNPKNFEADYNHGLAEAGALLLIAENFPELPEAATWRATAIERLDGMLSRVLDADGVEVEQSPFYHFYFLSGYWEIYGWARANKVSLPARSDERVRQMLRYGAQIVLPNGDVPLLGASIKRNVRKSEETPRYKEMAELDPGLKYMLTAGKEGAPPAETRVLFPSSCQAVMRSSFGTAEDMLQQTHVIVDVGPYRTDHSHLDALALHLYSAGRVLLPDSGLFSYELGPDYDYFHGTRAHNTVVVDGKDQREGSARAGLSAGEAGWSYQSGAHSLYEGVVHRRAVLLLRRDLVLVVDDLSSASPHTYEQMWHLFPGAELQVEGLKATALVPVGAGKKPLLSVHQVVPEGLFLLQRQGATEPLEGWYSERYELKAPIWTLRYRRQEARALYVTVLASGELASAPLEARAVGEARNLQVSLCLSPQEGYRVMLEELTEPGERVQVEPLSAPCSAGP
jgi:hypothetical protein